MKKTAGQPTKSSFEVIKTLYWYNFVKEKVHDELLVETIEEAKSIENARDSGRKWNRSRLRTLRNTEARLLGKGNFQKFGIKHSEIQKQLEKKEQELEDNRLTPKSGITKLSGKVWGRYASGLYTPSRILDELTLIYPTSKIAYLEGPNRIFSILESNTFKEALELLEEAIYGIYITDNIELYGSKDPYEPEFVKKHLMDFGARVVDGMADETEATFIFNSESTSAVEMFYKVAEFFKSQRMTLEIAISEEEYDYSKWRTHCDYYKGMSSGQAACIYLSIAFIAYKFLGDERILPLVIAKYGVLQVIQKSYGIKEDSWFFQKDENPNGIISIFIKMVGSNLYRKYLELVNTNSHDPIIEQHLLNRIKKPAPSNNTTFRFTGTKKRSKSNIKSSK